MPKKDKCSVCEKPVRRGPSSGQNIVCASCRGMKLNVATTELTCKRCTKSFTALSRQGNRLYCDSCQFRSATENRLRYVNKIREAGKEKEYNRIAALSQYGINPGHYDLLLDEQDDKCALCKTDKLESNGKQLHVDHDHKTKKVRGLLCGNCNRGLGMFKENVDVLQAAIDYLTKHRDRLT